MNVDCIWLKKTIHTDQRLKKNKSSCDLSLRALYSWPAQIWHVMQSHGAASSLVSLQMHSACKAPLQTGGLHCCGCEHSGMSSKQLLSFHLRSMRERRTFLDDNDSDGLMHTVVIFISMKYDEIHMLAEGRIGLPAP